MKKIFTFIAALFLLIPAGIYAQSFDVQHDTVTFTPVGSQTIEDGITPTTSNATIQWKVFETNFPSDWLAGTSICDNSNCYSSALLWPSEALKTSNVYTAGTLGDFHMLIDLDVATTLGTYYYRVRMSNQTVSSDTAIETYLISKPYPTSVPTVTSAEDVILYPNPAHDEVNVVYDQSNDIKSIVIYNIIGKALSVYKPTNNNSANLNVENIPSGIYFVRLFNSHGDVVVTRKFTKQ